MASPAGVGLTAAVGRNVGALIVRQVCDSSFVDCGIVFALILHEKRYDDMTSAPSTRGLTATAGGVGGDVDNMSSFNFWKYVTVNEQDVSLPPLLQHVPVRRASIRLFIKRPELYGSYALMHRNLRFHLVRQLPLASSARLAILWFSVVYVKHVNAIGKFINFYAILEHPLAFAFAVRMLGFGYRLRC